MKFRKKFISSGVLLFSTGWMAWAAVYTPPSGDLIINGSFEQGFSGWSGSLGLYDTPNPVSGSTVGVVTDIWSSSVNQCMSQTIPTMSGITYRISFGIRLPELYQIAPGVWVPVVGDSSGASTTIDLQLNRNTVQSIPVTSRDWSFYTIDFTAGTNSSLLTFYNGPGSKAWPFVDDVSVVVVPEPTSAGLFALSLAALCALGKRRSRTFKGSCAANGSVRPDEQG